MNYIQPQGQSSIKKILGAPMVGTNNLLVKTYYVLMKHKYGAAPTNTMFFAAHSPYSIIKKY
jgi:hypothetical protein